MATDAFVRLPYELHCEIIGHLPLASQILYQSQICRTLRERLGCRLTLQRPDLFSLLHWRTAAADVAELLNGKANNVSVDTFTSNGKTKSIWDNDASRTPRPAPTLKKEVFIPPFASCDLLDDADVRLLLKCVRLLGLSGGDEGEGALPPIRLANVEHGNFKIRALSLQSRQGFSVAGLDYIFRTQAALGGVETVLIRSPGSSEALLWSVFQPPCSLSKASRSVETQAIVIPGPDADRGRGLRNGFACLCFASASASFHVIFHDWYDEQEASGIHRMLECSEITCNACKRSIYY